MKGKEVICPFCKKILTAEVRARVKQLYNRLSARKQEIYDQTLTLMEGDISPLDQLELVSTLERVPLNSANYGFFAWKEVEYYRGNIRVLCWLMRSEERAGKCQSLKPSIPIMAERNSPSSEE